MHIKGSIVLQIALYILTWIAGSIMAERKYKKIISSIQQQLKQAIREVSQAQCDCSDRDKEIVQLKEQIQQWQIRWDAAFKHRKKKQQSVA